MEGYNAVNAFHPFCSSAMSVNVFFSYSHKDEALRDKLSEHLSLLKRNQVIQDWYDRQIVAGTEWADEIDQNLNTADIILLLISASFLASEYCWSNELKTAMQRHEAGEACVIPVILRPVDWQGAPFGKLQAFPKDARPVTKWEDQDEAFMNVAQGIRVAAERIAQRKQEHKSPLPTSDSETQQIKEAGQGEQHYRQEVIHCVREDGGEISAMSRIFLDGLTSSLELSSEQAETIEQSVLRPFQTYAQTLEGMARQQYPLTEAAQTRLKRLQGTLTLSDGEVEAIQKRVLVLIEPLDQPTAMSHPSVIEDDLSSEKGMDYKPLRDMLKAGKWQEADEETLRVMLEAMGRQKEGWLRVEDVKRFPCQDLRTIDQLWVKYSNGKFGFSVQKQIWQECGSPTSYNDNWKKFGECVGWRVKQEWIYSDSVTFDTSASKGHLPFNAVKVRVNSLTLSLELEWLVVGCVGLFSRTETCEL